MTGEKFIEVIDLASNAIELSIEIPEWQSSYDPDGDRVYAGYIKEVTFSEFIVVGREGETKIAVKRYVNIDSMDPTQGERVIETGMTSLTGIIVSEQIKTLYLVDRKLEFMSTYTLDNFGCAKGGLVVDCGGLFFSSVICKPNSFFVTEKKKCVCEIGHYHNIDSDTGEESCIACTHCDQYLLSGS
jgi:hypothetical protein